MRRGRFLSIVGAAVAVGVTLIGDVPGAAAAEPGPWQPTRSTPTSFAAGEVCPFAEQGVPVADHERFRTLATYPDGSPREQEFAGLLKFRYTNLANGRSVVRNETGTVTAVLHPDGTKDFTVDGTAENLCQTLA